MQYAKITSNHCKVITIIVNHYKIFILWDLAKNEKTTKNQKIITKFKPQN